MNPNNDNYYDVQIKSKKRLPYHQTRRVNSQPQLPTLNETKRPGDYYIQKLSNSSVNLVKDKRPISGDSILSLHSSYSDEMSSVASSNFEGHDSRLSSMTSNSIVSPSDSPLLVQREIEPVKGSGLVNSFGPSSGDSVHSGGSIGPESIGPESIGPESIGPESIEDLNASLSTITVKDKSVPPSPKASKSSSSPSLSLSRTKSKYMAPNEIKQRKLRRKQTYDESYNEDEILPNDIDLVFNVPVMKDQSQIYVKRNDSFSRSDLIDDVYKPFPLPGKLRSSSTPSLSNPTASNTSTTNDSSIIEEDEESMENDDSQITNNISNYYNERSKSHNKLMKATRDESMLYKLPNYVRSQSSLDDLNLMSPEKLNAVDQTRPINLPPKTNEERAKHNRQVSRMFSAGNNGSGHELKQPIDLSVDGTSSSSSSSSHASQWESLINDENFYTRLTKDKNIIRKLNWDTNCSDDIKYSYYLKVLAPSSSELKSIHDNYNRLLGIYDTLNDSIKANRNLEFNNVASKIINRPLMSSITELSDKRQLEQNFTKLLFLKSLDNNLHKHDEMFLIPLLLMNFPNNDLIDIFTLIKLIDDKVLTSNLLGELNHSLEKWSIKLPSKINLYLKNINLKEFQLLNCNNYFEILNQLNDKLPLSLSAPSTPIVSRSFNFENDSCVLGLMNKLLELLITYTNNPKTQITNQIKILQSFLVVIVKYYHINWNDFNELIKSNGSIKINYNVDQKVNMKSFNDKWKEVFRNI